MSEIKPSLIDLKALMLQYSFEHGVNFQQRTILISEDIDSETFKKVDAALTEMESESRRTVTIKINSTGGNVYDALAIVGRMKAANCTINTEGYGAVMSAAVAILAAGKRRKISSSSWIMVHQSHYELAGRVEDHKAYLEQAAREEEQWAQIMALHSAVSKDEWLNLCREKDYYMSADELMELGAVDEII
jgi:ATP-dependent Clp endopeptidase proteolytic subunit ClpP